MKKLAKLTMLAGFLSLALISCNEDHDFIPFDNVEDIDLLSLWLELPDTPFNYSDIELPAHFNAPPVAGADNTPPENEITDEIATLGRVLFYDKRLSANNTTSCASCHLQENGFSDPGQFSTGFEGGLCR